MYGGNRPPYILPTRCTPTVQRARNLSFRGIQYLTKQSASEFVVSRIMKLPSWRACRKYGARGPSRLRPHVSLSPAQKNARRVNQSPRRGEPKERKLKIKRDAAGAVPLVKAPKCCCRPDCSMQLQTRPWLRPSWPASPNAPGRSWQTCSSSAPSRRRPSAVLPSA